MKLVKRLAVCSRHTGLTRIVVAGGASYTGSPHETTAKVRLDDLTIEWAVSSEACSLDDAVGDVVLLWLPQWPSWKCRALRADRTVAWTVDAPQGGAIWRDRILFHGSTMAIVDPVTGAIERQISCPPEGETAVGRFVCGDLLLSATPDLAVLAAYDMATETGRWRVSLADRFRAAGLSIDPKERFTLIAAQAGWIVGHCSDALLVLSASTGEIPWVRPAWLASVVPVAHEERVYVSRWDPWDLLAMDQSTGATVFERPLKHRDPAFAIPARSVHLTIAGTT